MSTEITGNLVVVHPHQEGHVFQSFTHLCKICGAQLTVTDGVREAHVCRIDLDAQRAAA
jgi:hypothetical protein